MNPASVIPVAGAVWWLGACALLVASNGAALTRSWLIRRRNRRLDLPPLAVIVPVKDLHPGFEGDQASLFAQSYPDLEILVASAETHSTATEAALRVARHYPGIPTRLIHSDLKRAASPKLNKLWRAIVEARHDVILTKDSNVRLEPGDLASYARNLTPGVGLVSTIPIATEPGNLAAWIEAAIINYYARIVMLGEAAGLGFGLGKVMLFRRSDLESAGGLENIAWALGEDSALAAAMIRQGLRVVMADRHSRQILGRRQWRDIWLRQVRWMLVRRVQWPGTFFFAEPIASAFLMAAAGAVAAPLLMLDSLNLALATLAGWFLLETAVSAVNGWPVSILSPLAFLGRETLLLGSWLRACATDQVNWAGDTCTVAHGPSRVESETDSGTGIATAEHQ